MHNRGVDLVVNEADQVLLSVESSNVEALNILEGFGQLDPLRL